jgi:hypothetical protein
MIFPVGVPIKKNPGTSFPSSEAMTPHDNGLESWSTTKASHGKKSWLTTHQQICSDLT